MSNYTIYFTEICSLECQNNGKCVIQNKKAVCVCTKEYTGTTCETGKCDINEFCIITARKHNKRNDSKVA